MPCTTGTARWASWSTCWAWPSRRCRSTSRRLREAHLVVVRPEAQRRWYQLQPEPLRELDHWLEPYRRTWAGRLDALGEHLDRMEDHDDVTWKPSTGRPTDADLGELVRDGERVGLRFVRVYPHPVERVWRALTESDQLRYWLPCDIVGERRPGARSPSRSGRGTSRSTRSTSRR